MSKVLKKDILKIPTIDHLVIEGTQLNDANIKISGYRHSSNLLICAAIIVKNTTVTLQNVPNLLDTTIMIEILKALGANVIYENDKLTVNTENLTGYRVPKDLSKQLHGSVYLMPALLARLGKCNFGESGGCQIGNKDEDFKRPIDHILDVMTKFGAKVSIEGDSVSTESAQLRAATIDITKYSSSKEQVIGPLTSGATKTAILLALSVKQGKTVIHKPFLKSESIDLLDFIKGLGYLVSYNSERIEIEYREPKSYYAHQVISDPSEIITYIAIAGFHNIRLNLNNITLNRTWPILAPELKILSEIGIDCVIDSGNVIVKRHSSLKAADIEITVGGVCTDNHPLLILLLLRAEGVSTITEHVWHDRFNYIQEVNKYGFKLMQNENKVIITPAIADIPCQIISCPDLRAAALLVILALAAPGKSIVVNYQHLNRGYVNFIDNLKAMGGLVTECLSSI